MSSSRPNVLFILADDQRFDTMNALGNPAIRTPNLDRLVARGTSFTHAHIPGGTSAAVCMPSRAMIHTGRELFEIQGIGETVAPNHTLLGEAFRLAGYQTFGTGKWHNGSDAYARSFSDGAEIFFGGMNDHWNVPACHYDPTGEYSARRFVCGDPFHSKDVWSSQCDHITPGAHSTDLFANTTMDFLGRKDPDQPFFAYVSLMAPHDPRTMPEEFLHLYDDEDIPLPINFQHQHPYDTGALQIRDELLAAFPRQPDEIKQHLKEYYAMITHLDDAVGRLLDHLAASAELDNTIIVFSGDNGLAVGQHGLMGKQSLYDHSVRVPLIFAGPGIKEAVRRDDLCFLSDIFPTLCSLCGLDRPVSVKSRDLSDCLTSSKTDSRGRERLYLAYESFLRGVTDGHHKLIEYASGPTQLFDLRADPHETQNLAHLPEIQDTLRQLRAQLIECHRSSGEPEHSYGLEFWRARPDLLA